MKTYSCHVAQFDSNNPKFPILYAFQIADGNLFFRSETTQRIIDWMTKEHGEPMWLSSDDPADLSLEHTEVHGWGYGSNVIFFTDTEIIPLFLLRWSECLWRMK
jgi:hypothetical protein